MALLVVVLRKGILVELLARILSDPGAPLLLNVSASADRRVVTKLGPAVDPGVQGLDCEAAEVDERIDYLVAHQPLDLPSSGRHVFGHLLVFNAPTGGC